VGLYDLPFAVIFQAVYFGTVPGVFCIIRPGDQVEGQHGHAVGGLYQGVDHFVKA